MLKSLFRPKWQHKDVTIRLQAVQALDSIKDSEVLKQIAISDSDETVRQQAISRIVQLAQLVDIYQQTPFANDKAHIQSCWCSVLADASLTPALNAENIVLDCQDPHWLAAIVRYSTNASLKHLALTGLQDEAIIFQLLESTRDSQLWQRLIDQLQGQEALKKALDLIKGRDKKTTQLLRQRIEQLAQEEQAKQELNQQRIEIENRLAQLLKSEHTPLMEGLLLNLEQQLENPELASEKSLELLQQCQAKLSEQLKQEQAQQELTLATTLAKNLQQQLSDNLQLSDEEIAQLETLQSHSNLAIQEMIANIAQLEQAIQSYRELEQAIASETSKAQKHELITQALQLVNRHKVLKQHFHSSLEQQANQYQQLKKSEQKQHQQHKAQLQTLVEQADNAIANSDFALVNKLHRQARKLFQQLSNEEKNALHAAMQRMQAANNELQQWQEFATDPIREELCQAMEQLIHSKEAVNTIAQSIKDIQQQWKALGYCHDQTVWQRFQDLSQQAYAPCKAYFAEQRERKQFNAEQCRIICEQVEQFSQTIDWQQVDYRSLDKLLKSIDQEWKKYTLLERKDFHSLNQRYRNAKQPLFDKLKQHKQQNTQQLEQLVHQAQALLDLEDANLALQQYQAIHENWKAVGLSFFKAQQSLWQQLRTIGDTLYQNRSSQRNAAEEELQANVKQAQELIQQVKQAANFEQIEQLQQAFSTVGDLPKNQYKKIQADFHAAISRFHQQQDQAKLNAELAQLEALLLWQGGEIPEQWPNAWKDALTKRKEANEQQVKTLCIEAEILADIPSPQVDEALRMQIQMQQLQARFSQGESVNKLDHLSRLLLTWSSLDKQEVLQIDNLQQRFTTAFNAIKANYRA